jgi:antitoxin component of MazEF toxin-antitoxin module
MVKTLTKHGNSLALVIDKPILELLKIDADTPLEITTDGQSLVVSRARVVQGDDALEAALREVNAEYGDVLRNLAK